MATDDGLRVSTLELFFDLGFVFTLTQLTSRLAHDISGESIVRVALVFIVLFWMYGGYVWLTNQVPPDRLSRRLLLILGMAAFFICALTIRDAFDGSGVAFGVGYLLVIVVHTAMWTQVYGVSVAARFAPLNVLAALLLVAAGLVDGPGVYALWSAAIAIQFVTPRIAGRAAPLFPIRARHFVERHGLLLIVALGESVVAIGIGVSGEEFDVGVVVAVTLGLALVASLWWAYFLGDEEGAERAMVAATERERFGLAINGYFFAYIPILLGVITMAAGVERSVEGVGDRLDLASALMLAVGVSLFLSGDVAFRRTMHMRPLVFRAGAALAALGATVFGVYVAAAAEVVALVVIVVAALLAEVTHRRGAVRRPPALAVQPSAADHRS